MPKPNITELTCSICKHWKPFERQYEGKIGFCRAHPPAALVSGFISRIVNAGPDQGLTSLEGQINSYFPVTQAGAYCGEYHPIMVAPGMHAPGGFAEPPKPPTLPDPAESSEKKPTVPDVGKA